MSYLPVDYDAMFVDAVRSPAYLAAIARVVRPGDVVVEVGTGVGYYAVAACHAGAERVYAIERSDTVALAEALMHENGCADRVTCIRGDANVVELPERGTVLLADLRGATPLFGAGISTIASVRDRLCHPGARVIPMIDTINAAPCEAPKHWSRTEALLGDEFAGVSRLAVQRVVRSSMHGDWIGAGGLLAPGAVAATLDYRTILSPDVDSRLDWVIARDGVAEGVIVWFDAHLCDGVGYTTAPGTPRTVHAQAFLPFERPLGVRRGDGLAWRLRAKLVGAAYVLAWDTSLTPVDPARDSVEMRQSTLTSVLLDRHQLERRRATYQPAAEAFADAALLLSLVDGKRPVSEIAEELRRRAPGRFSGADDALDWVCSTLASVEDLSSP